MGDERRDIRVGDGKIESEVRGMEKGEREDGGTRRWGRVLDWCVWSLFMPIRSFY